MWKVKALGAVSKKYQSASEERMLQCCVFPIPKYLSESWTLNKESSQRIKAFEVMLQKAAEDKMD